MEGGGEIQDGGSTKGYGEASEHGAMGCSAGRNDRPTGVSREEEYEPHSMI
jgi:hypothetical protein